MTDSTGAELQNEKTYPMVAVMLGGETVKLRSMTNEEKLAWDFCEGEQWTAEELALITSKLKQRNPGT